MITVLDIEFAKSFCDFRKPESQFDVMALPFTTVYERAPGAHQLKLIDLQCNLSLKDMSNRSERIDKFYGSLYETKFTNLRGKAMKLLVMFGSMYIGLYL